MTFEKVTERNDFYRDSFRSMVSVTAGALAICAVSLVGNIYLYSKEPESRYFYVDREGRVIPAAPLNIPYVSQDFILNWASKAVSKAFTLNSRDYREQLTEIKDYFTDIGYEEFTRTLSESGQLNFILSKALVVGAVPQSVPVIENEAILQGSYAWKIRVPVRVTYSAGKESSDKTFMITIVIVRRPTHENPYGIGINQFLMKDA